MTTRDVHDRHMRHELDGDLDASLSDHAPDAIAATPDGIGSGHDYIRHVHTFCGTTPSPTADDRRPH